MTSPGPRHPALFRLGRAAVVLSATVAFLLYVFDAGSGVSRTAGLGDWMDPYFINTLLEHWHHSLRTLADPSSPPMYFPARRTLGYSHSLVLYAPFYVPFRLIAHPFQAYSLTLFAVMLSGSVSLYLLLRRAFALTFVEAVLLAAFFVTSPNIVNGGLGVWSQRATVFLIPTIALTAIVSRRLASPLARLALAGLSGFLAASLFTHDFYTAQFALLFLAMPLAWLLAVRRGAIAASLQSGWKRHRRGELPALIGFAMAAAWTSAVMIGGGAGFRFAGMRISSHDWRRPAIVALAALVALLWLRGWSRVRDDLRWLGGWLLAFSTGAALGLAGFLWVYLAAHREHPRFPEADLLGQLVPVDPASWTTTGAFLRNLVPYDTVRPFVLVLACAGLVWIPALRVGALARRYWTAAALVTGLVIVMPLTVDGVSVWRTLFAPLPGFAAIRDPKRVIYLYELAVVVATACALSRADRGSRQRTAVAIVVAVLLVPLRAPDVFHYLRPNAAYDRWVEAPLTIDPSCRSFFITRASPAYAARSSDMRTLYGLDALSIALTTSIPTLNGYSAWTPAAWDLFNPEEPVYAERVTRWIRAHQLTGVCALDVERRTMVPVRVP